MTKAKDFSDGSYDCSVCKVRKPLEDFPPAKNTLSKRHGRCRECKRSGERQYQKTKKYLSRRTTWEWNNHGIIDMTRERFEELFELQEGKCAICGTLENILNRAMCVDHDHETGLARGLLCTKCNVALGYFGDNLEIIERAINYMKNPPAQSKIKGSDVNG